MSVETQNAIISVSVLFVIPMLVTIPVTAFLCRYRLARKKRVSYGTMFSGAFIIGLFLAVVATCMEPDIWWSHEHKGSPEDFVVMLIFIATLCLLPALFVVVYYQRRGKRDEKSVA
jgi:ACR3 family arsenite efflux pump ArsB